MFLSVDHVDNVKKTHQNIYTDYKQQLNNLYWMCHMNPTKNSMYHMTIDWLIESFLFWTLHWLGVKKQLLK